MKIIEISESLTDEQTMGLTAPFVSAFEQPPSPDFHERLNKKPKLSVLMAQSDRIEGFKIGYERFRGVFFSWIGGVLQESRRKGIARTLLRRQHVLCLERGYNEIQTETFGDGKAMLLLNIQEGFEVYGTYLGTDGRLRVQLRKMLIRSNSEQGEGENGEHHGADKHSR